MPEILRIEFSNLKLDSLNPRLGEFGIESGSSQKEILTILWMTVKEEVHVKVFFHQSCTAKTIGPSGWNKLVGLSTHLDPHKNSARWAWRYDQETEMIKLASYMWINGEKPTPERYINDYWKILTMESESLGAKASVPKLGEGFFISGLWFGGRGTPDQDLQVSYIFGERKGFNISTD